MASTVHIVCPRDPDDHDRVRRLAAAVAEHAPSGSLLILFAPGGVGATDVCIEELEGRGSLATVDVAVVAPCPPTREPAPLDTAEVVAIGAERDFAAQRAASLLCPLPHTTLFMSPRSAETIPMAAATVHDAAQRLSETLHNLCEGTGADELDVMRTIRCCEDTWFSSADGDAEERRQSRLVDDIFRRIAPIAVGGVSGGPGRVAEWGLGERGERATGASIASGLAQRGVAVSAYDPRVSQHIDAHPDLEIATNPYHAAATADALVILSDDVDLERLDLALVAKLMRKPRVIDAVGAFDAVAETHNPLRVEILLR